MAVDENGNEIVEQPSETEKRIKDLSSKVKTASEATETEKLAREAAESKTLEVERERDFYSGFSDVVATNPQAKEFKDDILAKVKSGYTVEDATFAVLGKAGKLGMQPEPKPEEMHIAGGSATNSLPQNGATKPISEMTREEKRAELQKAEARGDISLS
jgi:hypothetical protein